MKRVALVEMTVDELVERFIALALGQDEADLDNDIPKFTRLFWQMEAVEGELKSREGDQRRSLMDLYQHRNAQVRLCAAKATLAVAPKEAQAQLQKLRESHEFPQAGDAGMTLRALDEGIFKPT
jgi:uncharacterized protein DUF2019